MPYAFHPESLLCPRGHFRAIMSTGVVCQHLPPGTVTKWGPPVSSEVIGWQGWGARRRFWCQQVECFSFPSTPAPWLTLCFAHGDLLALRVLPVPVPVHPLKQHWLISPPPGSLPSLLFLHASFSYSVSVTLLVCFWAHFWNSIIIIPVGVCHTHLLENTDCVLFMLLTPAFKMVVAQSRLAGGKSEWMLLLIYFPCKEQLAARGQRYG